MKKFKIAFHTKYESLDGFEHSSGWREYKVKAKNVKSAKKKAQELWQKDYKNSKRFWIEHIIVN